VWTRDHSLLDLWIGGLHHNRRLSKTRFAPVVILTSLLSGFCRIFFIGYSPPSNHLGPYSGPGRCDVIILSSTPVVVFGFLKASMRWGSSRSWVAMESSSTVAVGVGSTTAVRWVFWRLRETQALRSSLYFLFFSRAFVLDGWDSCPRILFLRICVCTRFLYVFLANTYYQKKSAVWQGLLASRPYKGSPNRPCCGLV
jgi:hypothetical protein